MSQVSPDGQYVVSTFARPSARFPKSYYAINFKDYRFLQVFYPTRGILAWYSRATGRRQPLPGADDPHYVQTGAVWSPDGKYMVFARAEAKDPTRPASRRRHANDPNETQIQYDLYRIPFNDGKGGKAEPNRWRVGERHEQQLPQSLARRQWIVFVQCRNGQLMRPDSKLYIVPFEGGEARPLDANTAADELLAQFLAQRPLAGFSSKGRSPYTQMYLTHIDANGNDSPAILIENATASNRAVNIPEFVNTAGDGIQEIQIPAINVYRLMEQTLDSKSRNSTIRRLSSGKKLLRSRPTTPACRTISPPTFTSTAIPTRPSIICARPFA